MDIAASEKLDHLRLGVEVAGVEVPEFVLPQDRDVVLRGMRLHYLDWGTQGRRTILWLHGGGLTAHTWDLVCLALRKEYHCLALDQRGHGDSEWSPVMNYGAAAHVGDIEALVDLLGLDQFVLVGMSMGGMNSMLYSGRHSDRLKGLVLVDVGPEMRPDGAKKLGEFMSMPAELDSVEDFVKRSMTFNPRRDPRLLRRSLLHNLRQLPNGQWTWKYDRRHRIRSDRAQADFRRVSTELWNDVAQIKCPTLVVRGGESGLFWDEDAEKLARALPDGRWARVDGASHTVQGDNPQGLLGAIRGFFEEIGA